MRTNVLIIVSAVVVPYIILAEDVQKKKSRPVNYLRNFYDNYDDHARASEYFLRSNSTHHVRHKHDANRKLNKITRCKRYAQIYYQNYVPNCYHSVCRNRYCGYCPTSSCRRCNYNCPRTTPVITPFPIASTSQATKDCDCDKHGSKIPACDQKGKCICKPHYVGSKCERCELEYYKSNSECIPCKCDPNGSATSNCHPETGNCECKSGVHGRRCDACRDKHYGSVTTGCKACDPCEKEGHICHPENGKCVCPKLTEGPKCERCVPNAWGHEPGIGCKSCGCSPAGSLSPQCDSIAGRCTCKLGFEGEKCDKCSYGYYGYPNCRLCKCNEAGTLRKESENGICKCHCKDNVKGTDCANCTSGTFGMHVDNPLGCISCFCSHRSSTCSESSFVRDPIRTNSVRKIDSRECGNSDNCWALPEKFYGDLIHWYGGYLRVSSNSPKHSVYLTGNKITIEGLTDARGDIKLTEIWWKVKHSEQAAFPSECLKEPLLKFHCLMIVLQNVSAIRIKQHFSSPQPRFEVLLDKKPSKSVEKCPCPKEYASSSCQDPNEGYYRYRPKPSERQYKDIDRIFGVAKPCECHNRSKTCDKETGHCLNCGGFTTGPHCDSCIKGYYKNHQGNCSPCLCPSEHQNFADSCTLLQGSPKRFVCKCKPAYSGPSCNQCNERYWGNPQDPKGSCEPCNCNPYGSSHLRCDQLTGQCQCKPGFTGKHCSKCSSPRQVIQDGVCIACDECTQILFHTLDDLSEGLNDTLDLFKNGLGPPWRLLNSTIYSYRVLSDRFDDLQKAEEVVKTAKIPDLVRRTQVLANKVPEQKKTILTQIQTIGNIEKAAEGNAKTVQDLDKKVDNLIKSIDGFGKSHINVQEALREAKELLRDIKGISQETPSTEQYQNFFNKCDKFSKDVNDYYADGLNATELRKGLLNLKQRLSHLDEELNRTERINNLAQNKNKRNSERINSLKRTISELDKHNSVINQDILEQLKKMEATNSLLEDLGQIYKLLSEIDLQKTTSGLENNDDETIYETLEKVRKYVLDLQQKIKTYKDIFNFTPDEWTKIDATGAYDSIVKGIENVKKEADKAWNITREALEKVSPGEDDSMIDKTNLAMTFSDRIKKRAENLKTLFDDFSKTSTELETLRDNILKNGKNNNELNSFMRTILKNITTSLNTIQKLKKAEKDARNISALIESIDQKFNNMNITMQHDLIKMYQKYVDLVTNSELNNLKASINGTKGQLAAIDNTLNTTLFDNINQINRNRFNSTTEKLELMKKQIQNLTNLIQYANERVEAVEYGVNILECQRSYKLENDVFRSLEINFRCKPHCSLFYLKGSNNNVLKVSYSDGIVSVQWNNLTRNIIGNASVTISRMGSSIQIQTDKELDIIPSQKPFLIESKHLLHVGDNETTNVEEACLQKIKINGHTIGLWKFSESRGNCLGCPRKSNNNEGLVNVFFNGNGYREVLENSIGKLRPGKFVFRFSFVTFDENSLIFLAQDTTADCSFIALNMKDGFLELNVKHINGESIKLTSNAKYNNGSDTIVEVSMIFENSSNQNYLLKVLVPSSNQQNTTRDLKSTNVYKLKKSKIFIGGISSTHNASCVQVNTTSFLGNLNVSLSDIEISKQNSLSTNIESRFGTLELSRAWFPGDGNLVLETSIDITDNSELGFIIKPVSTMNNFIMNINNVTDVFLRHSYLFFKPQNGTEVKFGPIIPNSHHFINLTSKRVTLDGISKDFTTEIPILRPHNRFRLGSNVSDDSTLSYVGSIGDIFIDNSTVMFSEATVKSFKNVEIGRDRLLSKKDSTKEMQNTERYLSTPDYRTEPQAFKFGDKPNSFVFIKNTVLGKKFILEFQFRTFYPNGLLFLSESLLSSKNLTSYTILEIQGGDIRLKVQNHKAKMMKINERINDGDWHHVQVEQILGKKKWRLIVKVDKKWKVKERAPRNSFNGDLYLGGVPSVLPVHKKIKNELHPFRGCIRSLKINKNPQVVKNNNNVVYSNIGQCFQNVEEGAYFGGDAFAIYKYGFKVNKLLELSFEFKTREPNGILLSVSNLGNSPALSVELQNGAVVMTIDMGNGIVSKVTNSPHSDATLANNEWHNITALYSSLELTVNVDGVRKSWVQSDFNSMMDEIEAPLYVGGLPSNAPSGTLKIKENFKGCIRKFKIEDNIMDWTDMKKLNNVQLNSCLA